MSAGCRDVLLTFDVERPASREDYVDDRLLLALHKTLILLDKYELKALHPHVIRDMHGS